jgi:hypothetical protein
MTKKSIVVFVKINASRGNFVMERAGTPFWKFFLSAGCKLKWLCGTFFP